MKFNFHCFALVALSLFASASQAAETPVHLTVKEWLKGSVARYASDSSTSVETPFQFEVLIDVPDVDRYMSDPIHDAAMTGSIRMGDVAEDMPILEGRTQFFVSSERSDLKYFVYHIVFMHPRDGLITLFGKKYVQGPVSDLWSDVSTLYAHLYPGNVPADFFEGSARPASMGRGTLHILLPDLIRSFASIRTPGASLTDAAQARVQFGALFFDNLWQVYGLK